jgi:hemolysin activation/secretion protein
MAGAPKFSSGTQVGSTAVEFGLEAKGKQVQFGVVADNGGMASTGRTRVGVSISGDNAFRTGDSYAFTIMDSDKNAWTGIASASTPISYTGLRLAGQITRQQYNINGVTSIVGTSTVIQGGLQYPFARGLDSNIWGSLWLVHNRAGANLTDFGYSTHSTINSVQVAVQADNGDRAMQLRSNRWNAQAAITVGNNSNNDPNDAVTKRSGNYAKVTGRASGSYNLTANGNWFVNGQINGQLASKNLDSSEQMAMGGPNAVRGYRSDEGSVDEGFITNVGIYRRFPITTGHQMQLSGFVDFGFGRVNHAPWDGWASSYPGVSNVKNTRVLTSYGLGVDWLTPVGVTFSLAVAKPFGWSPASWVNPGKKPVQYWLSAGWSR